MIHARPSVALTRWTPAAGRAAWRAVSGFALAVMCMLAVAPDWVMGASASSSEAAPASPADGAAPSAAPASTDGLSATTTPALGSSASPASSDPASTPAAPLVQSAPVRSGSVQGTPVAQARPVAASARPAGAPAVTRPLWDELTHAQRSVLQPLAPSWNTTNEAQKRKWLTLANQFGQLSADEQGRLQARMGEWAALSPQQRSAARLNFAQARSLSVSEMQAQWQAYQALSDDEKRRLADSAQRKPAGAATAVTPVPRERLATVHGPAVRGGSGKAVLSASALDPVTLLPAASAASGRPATPATAANPAQ